MSEGSKNCIFMKQGNVYGTRERHTNANPYARISNQNVDQNAGTYVPGMHEDVSEVQSDDGDVNSTPIVGFFYSISRRGIGEYWPLHLGANTIGRADDCDVCLQEMTVSEHHATISIKQMKSTHKLIASIRDIGSQNGMYLNDEELDYENHTCKSNDLITVGHCYKLLLLLVDAEQCGLSVAENFVHSGESSQKEYLKNKFDPYNSEDRNVIEGTVDLSGNKFGEPGGTSFI